MKEGGFQVLLWGSHLDPPKRHQWLKRGIPHCETSFSDDLHITTWDHPLKTQNSFFSVDMNHNIQDKFRFSNQDYLPNDTKVKYLFTKEL